MARMTTEQAVSAIRAINTAITVEAIKTVLMSCNKQTMVQVYEVISESAWKGNISHTLKANLVQQLSEWLYMECDFRVFNAMTAQEKYTALTTRGVDYALGKATICCFDGNKELQMILGIEFADTDSLHDRKLKMLSVITGLYSSQTTENAPAVEVAPTVDEISKTAEKYFASEMTGDEVEAVMKKAESETLREFARQREIPIEDNEDHAGLVKIVMEDLVCEKLGVYDEEPTDGETYIEPEQTAPVIKAVKVATTENEIVYALMPCTTKDMLRICTELTGIERTRIACGMLPKRHTAEKVARLIIKHREEKLKKDKAWMLNFGE